MNTVLIKCLDSRKGGIIPTSRRQNAVRAPCALMEEIMQRFMVLCFASLTILLLSALPVAAFDCELQVLTKNGKQIGTAVISDLDHYCGTVYMRGGGYMVKIDGQPRKYFDANYSYKDVLNYMCDTCKYRKKDILTDQ